MEKGNPMQNKVASVPVRRGRPPAPEGTARSRRVVTFVTEGEFDLLQRWADSRDVPLSSLVYELLAPQLHEND